MISVSSTAFCAQSLETTMEEVSKEFQRWEIFSEGEHYLPHILDRFLEIAPSYDLKISVHAPISDVNLAASSERMRESSVLEMMATVECALQMGAELVTVHPGIRPFVIKGSDEKALARAAKSLRTIDRVSQEFGVQVAVENMPDFFMMLGKSASELEAIIDGTDLGICFDIGHANTTGQIDELLSLKDRFVNFHIHDNNGAQDEHLTLGEGNIDFASVLSQLKDYSGPYVIESLSLESAVESRDILAKLL